MHDMLELIHAQNNAMQVKKMVELYHKVVQTQWKYSSTICNTLPIPAANDESLMHKITIQKISDGEQKI